MGKAIIWATLAFIVVTATTAMADSLDGRLGFTGRGGAIIPLRNDFISGTSKARTGITAGGGLIFGLSKSLAIEADVNHSPSMDVEIAGSKAYEATLTDIGIGAQYRFPGDRVVPFVGIGADFVKGTLKSVLGGDYDLDWTEGGHLKVGVDCFVNDGIALTVEVKGMYAAKGDVKTGGAKVGEYDPRNIIASVGLRLILPKSSAW